MVSSGCNDGDVDVPSHNLDHNLGSNRYLSLIPSRIKNITEAYTSDMMVLKELVDTLQTQASSDLIHMKSRISDQIMAVENVFKNAVMQAENATCDIQNSIADQLALCLYLLNDMKRDYIKAWCLPTKSLGQQLISSTI
ncbi:hypothetical protein L2E82_06643 [Cichorium intybus]|uniref:Uncharacterized protein n=1 Tax=Cichorium intybus TaxID=13427 RepID=A0ACB9HAM6_CICIN|nr:hypothetical protein L2E82_06643 [Cichorium intybus]